MSLITADIKFIFKALQPFHSRLVGGIVRDYLLDGTVSDDIDIATTAHPNDIMKQLKKAGLHVIPTGIKHGTVTAIYNDTAYEITTLRHDKQTDGRHATVEFTDKFNEDAKRRDFTFNALYMDENEKISDFFDGKADLEKRHVRFIGNAEDRIKEDYLRILRYFRFHGKFNEQPVFNEETLSTIKNLSSKIQTLSNERITVEMIKILNGKHTFFVINNMLQTNVCSSIGLNNINLKKLGILLHHFPQVDAFTQFVCLLQNEEHLNFSTFKLTFTNKQKSFMKRLHSALTTLDITKNIYQQTYHLGKEITLSALMIKHGTEDKIIQDIQNFKVPIFPITGADLIELGVEPGIKLGNNLHTLENWWILNNFPSKEKCITYFKMLKISLHSNNIS